MKPLRILHTDFHRGWGGQAARVLMLSGELARRGHRVTIAAPAGELTRRARRLARDVPALSVEDCFRFHPPSHAPSFIGDIRRMSRLFRNDDFDIVDVHGSQDTWVTALTRGLTGLPRRLVLTRHNTKRVRTGPANRWLYARLINHLIIVDESVRREYASFIEDGTIDPERITVIPSAYRADLFHDGVDGSLVRRELGLPDEAIVIGVAGRLVLDKGQTFLLQAVGRLRDRFPGLVVLLAGLGPNESALRREAEARGLASIVRFLGFREDIAAVAAAFDIAVLPSVGCDASSASIKEAMALGVPVVASDIGGARSIIEDGVTGLVVPPADPGALAAALETLIQDRSRARSMAVRARAEVSRRFSIKRMADRTLDVYEATLAREGAARGLARGPVQQARRSA